MLEYIKLSLGKLNVIIVVICSRFTRSRQTFEKELPKYRYIDSHIKMYITLLENTNNNNNNYVYLIKHPY